MDSIISSLNSLFTNIKNLSLPGVLAAFGFVLLLWPPQPIDVVNDVGVNEAYKGLAWPTKKEDLEKYAGRIDPVCNTNPAANERALPNPQTLEENKSIAVADQFNLERIARTLGECTEKETALNGFEVSKIAAKNAEIDALTKRRDAIQDTYLSYVKTANPLAGAFGQTLERAQDEIRDKQTQVREIDQLNRERVRRIGELGRLSKDITERLGEPGRLRPVQRFDDFLASLSNHVIAFLALALGWSILFEPINRALFGLVYDRAFRDHMDILHPGRNPSDPEEQQPPPDGKVNLAYFWGLLIAIAIVIVYWAYLHQEGVTSPPAAPCKLLQVDCVSLLKTGPPLLDLVLGCILFTLAGLQLSVLASLVRIRIVHKNRERARARAAQSVFPVVMWALAPSMYKFLRGKGEESAPATTPPPEPPVKKDKTCEEQLRDLWKKISQPEYAIGQGILSQDDYNSIKDTYYGQSQISIGLILPVAFLTFAILATPQLGLKSGWTVWPGLALAQGLLLWVGADRKHKFETTVESFISSRFLNTCNAKKDAAKTKAATPAEGSKQRKLVRDELKSLLKGAKIGDSRLEIILPPDDPAANEPTQPPGTPPATPPEQSPAGAQGAEAPSQGPILPMDDPAGSTS